MELVVIIITIIIAFIIGWKIRPSTISKQGVPPAPAESPVPVSEKDFEKKRIASITFNVDRLPFLKTLLASYEEAQDERVARNQEYRKLNEAIEGFAREFTWFVSGQWETQQNTNDKWLEADERCRRIIIAYAGTLLNGLEDLRSKGWDGKNKYYADVRSYDSDSIWRLHALIDALEAGNAQATIDIPTELSGDYESWLVNHITYAIQQSKGPASENK